MRNHCKKSQQGISAIAAIIFIVLFALIGSYLATFLTVSALNTAASSREMQSWFAAKSGIEWTVYTALYDQPGSCLPATCGAACCSASIFPIGSANAVSLDGPGLNGYEFYLNSCSADQVTEAGTDYCVYNVNLTARAGTEGQIDYSLRNLSISFTDLNAP